MKNAMESGFRQAAGLWMVLVPGLVLLLTLTTYIGPTLEEYQQNGFLTEGFHNTLLLEGFRSDTLASFLPILAVLPFAGSYLDDLRSRYARMFLIRSSCRAYLISRAAVAFLTGGLVILLGVGMTWGSTALVFLPVEHRVRGLEPVGGEGIGAECFLMFLNGGLWAVLGMTLSTLMESKYIAYASPFIVYYLLVILYERYFPNAWLLYPKNWLDLDIWPYGVGGAALFLLELTFLCGLVFYIRAKRRLEQL